MNEIKQMNTGEFANCLNQWGSDLNDWPRPEQAAGKRLLDESVGARELLAKARALDDLLATATRHQAPADLARRIIEQIPEQDVWQRMMDWFAATWWRPAVAATCTLAIGFAVGLAQPGIDDGAMLEDVSMLAFSSTYEEFEDGQP